MHRKHAKFNNSFLRYSTYVISLGGFLFGYDTGVINGALAFMSKPSQLDLTPALQGVVSSALVLGACIGALGCGSLADRFGRKKTLRWIAALFTISTIFCAVSMNFMFMAIFRFILGLAVGAASSLSPMYLAEISPEPVRTNNVNKNAIFIVMGQLTAFCVNAILGNIWGNWGPIWRVMIISASIPAIFLWFNSFHISGSPRWLLLQNKVRRARHLFSRLGFPREVSEKLANNAKNTEDTGNGLAWRSIWKKPSLIYLLFSGAVIALIQQISGVNTVMYYGTILLERIGMGQSGSLYANVLIGFVSVLASIFGTRLIAKYDHHRMLLIGLSGNILFLALLAFVMHLKSLDQAATSLLVLVFLALFLASHQGIVSPVTWLIMSEMFPTVVQARFMSIATATTWITNFVISLIFPLLISSVGVGMSFFIFALSNGVSVLLSIFVINKREMHIAYEKNDFLTQK
ncbi:sugar porter family MFS transporter [Oenococcus sicerae]|uniref:Sugar porter family MFS transporter n=1 Tax=Oenococcus sicerae TaxID=2203724 RepID=A0ABX5QKU8_9LACO|nr:sugar porter family MFS transporter [Oenococcus sicerae]QAS69313.1 sugar porter family MFS transporter [Oenococcus sicerae]